MLLLILLTLSGISQSHFDKLIQEFFKNNIQVNQSRNALQLTRLDYQNIAHIRPWNLSLSSSFKDNQLDSASRFGNRQATTWANTMSFQKDFIWGGSLILNNHFTRIHNASSSASVVFGGPQKTNEFGQDLTYKQALGADFLDQYSELEMAESSLVKGKIHTKNTIERELLKFYEAYQSASLNKELHRLQKEAVKRAQKRVRLVKKRVKDGLRQSVDLHQADMDEMRQKEELKNTKMNLHDKMERLSHFLHRKVSVYELEMKENPSFKKVEKEIIKHHETAEKNSRVLLLREMIESQKIKLKRMEYRLFPRLEFISKYSSNRYADNFSNSFSRGLLGHSKKEWLVGFQFNIPLGFELEKISVGQERIRLKQIERELIKTSDDVQITSTSLASQFHELKKNIAFAEKRSKLAKKILKEYNYLYRLGEKDLDRVIHAEETLIQTERSIVNYRVNKNRLLANFAYLHGYLRDSLTQRHP